MTAVLVFWLLVALLLGWLVGAYNRLIRLRAQVNASFSAVDQRMVQALALLNEATTMPQSSVRPNQVEEPGFAANGNRAGLQEVAIQFEVALRVVRRQALDASAVAALQTAHATVQTVWERRHAEIADPAGTADVGTQRAWEDNSLALRDAVTGFNGAVSAYNLAIGQFPASILAHLFSFKPAASL